MEIIKAIVNNDFEYIKNLNLNTDLNFYDDSHKTPLYYICLHNNYEILSYVLKNFNIDILDDNDNNSLSFLIACKNLNDKIIMSLISINRNVIYTNINEETCFNILYTKYLSKEKNSELLLKTLLKLYLNMEISDDFIKKLFDAGTKNYNTFSINFDIELEFKDYNNEQKESIYSILNLCYLI